MKLIDIFTQYADLEPFFGLEQNFLLIDGNTNKPYNYDDSVNKNVYYCGLVLILYQIK